MVKKSILQKSYQFSAQNLDKVLSSLKSLHLKDPKVFYEGIKKVCGSKNEIFSISAHSKQKASSCTMKCFLERLKQGGELTQEEYGYFRYKLAELSMGLTANTDLKEALAKQIKNRKKKFSF